MKNIFTCIFVLAFFLLTAHIASAAVRISEIMYDPSGTDSNHEWIEIENDGDTSIDISGWKFFENNSNHTLTSVAGGTTIAAHGFAIIAENAAVFQTDYPQFGGVLFDSVFSLSNIGETLTLKDSTGVVINEAIYTSSPGANGDSNSLYGSQSTWSAGLATPGAPVQTNTNEGNGEGENDSNSDGNGDTTGTGNDQTENQNIAGGGLATPANTTTKTSAEKAKAQKKIIAKIVLPIETILFDANAIFTAKITGTDGNPLLRGNIFWNFGDSESIFTKNVDPVTHVFSYPGRYVVTLQYFENYYDREPKSIDRATVIANVPKMEFLDDGLTLSLKNTGKTEVDISGWIVDDGTGNFIFPKSTILLAGSMLILEKKKLNLQNAEMYNLSYSNGNPITTTAAEVASVEISESKNIKPKKPEIIAQLPKQILAVSMDAKVEEIAIEENATILVKSPEETPITPPTVVDGSRLDQKQTTDQLPATNLGRTKIILTGAIAAIIFLSILLARGTKSKSETDDDLANTEDIENE